MPLKYTLSNVLPSPTKGGQRKEGIYRLFSLLQFYSVIIILYILSRILFYFTNTLEEHWVELLVIPIALLLLLLVSIIAIMIKIKQSYVPKQKAGIYLQLYDGIKVLFYIVLSVLITEFKVLDEDYVESGKQVNLFWLAAELAIILWPTILALHTKIAHLVTLIFYFIYSYFRLLGFQQTDNVDASFWLIKFVPLLIYIYRFRLYEESTRIDKKKQNEQRKFANTVLNLLPEGIAIVDADGLKYVNNSMRTILRVKDEECLKALEALENRQFVDENANNVKKSFSALPEGQKVRNSFFKGFDLPVIPGSRMLDENLKANMARDAELAKERPPTPPATSGEILTKPKVSKKPMNMLTVSTSKSKSLNYKAIMESETHDIIDVIDEKNTRPSVIVHRDDNFDHLNNSAEEDSQNGKRLYYVCVKSIL